jgi:hypothetical protein
MIVDANIAISVDAFHSFQGQPAAWIAPMNILSLNQQISVISALTEGCSIRSVERLTGIHRDTIMRLAARVGLGAITGFRIDPELQTMVSGEQNRH